MKLIKKVTFILSTLLIISSCRYDVTFFPYFPQYDDEDTYTDEDYDHYYKPAGYTKDYIDIFKSNKVSSSKVVPLPSSGNQKILVLPVAFPDYSLDNLDGNNGETAHVHLQNAFFGKNNATSWHSVTGFYNESSYGKLQIGGEVAPWYTLPADYTVEKIRDRVNNNNDKLVESANIVNHALFAYETAFPGEIDKFDQDNDGIVDSVYVVYGYPYEEKDKTNIFWAFAANMNRLDSRLTRQANSYAWSSYHYMNVSAFRKPDAHTYIHEVGHLIGLNDYYNTNYNDPYAPLGGFDMMDYTLGDHTGLSKMLMNWARPFVPTKSGEIKLRPFSQSGDLILLKPDWNGRANDEYLLLEYYTPEGLNELDSRLNAEFKLPRTRGIKLYHVDARTAYQIREGNINRYIYVNDDKTGEYTGGVEVLAHGNSSHPNNNSPIRDFLLYKLLEPKESGNIDKSFKLANGNSLFKVGDDIGINYFNEFVFNDQSEFNYKVLVKDIGSQYATIEIEVI